jgi:hypothetical protein
MLLCPIFHDYLPFSGIRTGIPILEQHYLTCIRRTVQNNPPIPEKTLLPFMMMFLRRDRLAISNEDEEFT